MSKCLAVALGSTALYGLTLLLFLTVAGEWFAESPRLTIFALLVVPSAGGGLAAVLAARDREAGKGLKQAKWARVIGGFVIATASLFYLLMRALEWFESNVPRLH